MKTINMMDMTINGDGDCKDDCNDDDNSDSSDIDNEDGGIFWRWQ